MIVFVDLEHARLQTENPRGALHSMALRLKIKYRLEDISGEPCLIMRYPHVTPERLAELGVKAVVVSGNSTEFEHYSENSLAGLRATWRAASLPTIGFCGGAQLMAQSFGAQIGPIGQLPPGVEDDPVQVNIAPAGYYQESGFLPVRVVQPHPLLAGLGEQPTFAEYHYWEIKAPPLGFQLLASTDKCQVQLIAHEKLPLYIAQFHAEQYSDEHADGRTLLANFFRLAGVIK